MLATLGFALLFVTSYNAVSASVSRQEEHLRNKVYAQLETGWNRKYSVSDKDLDEMREEVRSIFAETLGHYMDYAFPMDDLKPISCQGSNSLGGVAITLLDSLDTLIVMNKSQELKAALKKIEESVSFDIDQTVEVFEINIRGLGGLLSAHVLLKRNPELAANYTDSLLKAALDLGQRLLPAFETMSGIPRPRVHLKDGDRRRLTGNDMTCCACAGTLLIEMGMLSRLTGQTIFEEKAKSALYTLFNLRSDLGLLGNVLDIQRMRWHRSDTTIGGGVDSTYEYLLKAYVLFGDVEYLKMFTELYSAVMQHMRTPMLASGYQWIADVHMTTGNVIHPWISSLSAFWPGLQALAGLCEAAKDLHGNYTDIWMKYAALPEKFSLDGKRRHPQESGYPLRPELIESTYLLYSVTQDPQYLELARVFQKSVLATNTSECGFGHIKDVTTGELQDSMESFFLAETLKYLFLLQSNSTSLINSVVFSTEAHIFPPVAGTEAEEQQTFARIPQECTELCVDPSQEEIELSMEEIERKFPLLKPSVEDFKIIQGRRCRACVHITTHLQGLPKRNDEELVERMGLSWALSESREEEEIVVSDGTRYEYNLPEANSPFEVTASMACILTAVSGSDTPRCERFEPVRIAPDRSGNVHMFVPPSALVLRKLVPHNQVRGGRLVVLDQSDWREFIGVVHEHKDMTRADLPASQPCPGAVAGALAAGKDLTDFDDCRNQLVYGEFIVSDPISACGRIQNIDKMKGAIVVTHQNSCKTSQKLSVFQSAGAAGVVILKNTQEEDEWQSALVHYFGELPVFIVSSRDSKQFLEILRCQKETRGMMGKATTSILQCPLPVRSFRLPKEVEDGAKVEVLVTKETTIYFANAVAKGELSKPSIHKFLRDIGNNRKVFRAFSRIAGHRNGTV